MSNTFQELAHNFWVVPQTGGMRVPGLVVASQALMAHEEMAHPLEQVRNVAHLPGIVGHSIAMPDIHWGYGFPIGGVAAMDCEEGVISPGGVGYDINCGVRLALAPFPFHTLTPAHQERLLQALFKHIPSGVGHGHTHTPLTDAEYAHLLVEGARWAVDKGWGVEQDLEHTESHGCLPDADPHSVSSWAKERGRKQLGTIGSGNHFVEIGEVEKIFLPEVAQTWDIQVGQLYVLIHSGSRGLGHQVCQETVDAFLQKGYGNNLPDPQLVAAPLNSSEGRAYFAAMNAAANFAFNNRQCILHAVRRSFTEVCSLPAPSLRLLYDVCHNIAKYEEHTVHGHKKTVCVHRKGATRAYGKGAPELAPLFRSTGQPVLVPGDMGRASHILVGQGHPMTWCSCCHGAGRICSRMRSKMHWQGRNPIAYMHAQGVLVKAHSLKTIVEEMPDAYKDVDAIVDIVEGAHLAHKVARLRPRIVLKG